jgi:hypothetical protein
LCSKLWSSPIPKRRRTGTSAGITDRRFGASAQLARGASGPALLEAISPGPSLHLRDQGESCKQQLGFRPKAFRETIDSGNNRGPVRRPASDTVLPRQELTVFLQRVASCRAVRRDQGVDLALSHKACNSVESIQLQLTAGDFPSMGSGMAAPTRPSHLRQPVVHGRYVKPLRLESSCGSVDR